MARVNVSSNYEYITNSQKSVIESDIPEKLSIIQDNLLDFELEFNKGTWYLNELKVISKELESMAQYFLEQNGMGGGNLYKGVHAEPTEKGIIFYNKATNSRGQYYAGHIEYGHRLKNGGFYPAWPFMRPALYAVSKASQGTFANILGELASGVFKDNGKGYQGVKNLNFGHKFEKFKGYKNPQPNRMHHYTRKGLEEKSKINPKDFSASILTDSQFRNPFSIKRGINGNIKSREDVGFNQNGRNINTIKSFQEKVSKIKRNRMNER